MQRQVEELPRWREVKPGPCSGKAHEVSKEQGDKRAVGLGCHDELKEGPQDELKEARRVRLLEIRVHGSLR